MIVIDIYKQNFLNVAENIVLQTQASEAYCFYLIQIQKTALVLNFYKQSLGQNSSMLQGVVFNVAFR